MSTKAHPATESHRDHIFSPRDAAPVSQKEENQLQRGSRKKWDANSSGPQASQVFWKMQCPCLEGVGIAKVKTTWPPLALLVAVYFNSF